MKNLYLSLFAFLFFCRISLAQNYVPLQLDSFHSFYEGISPKSGGLDTQLLFAAYSYNIHDTLIQLRQPYTRTNYFYTTDTNVAIVERNLPSPWHPISRTTNVYNNGKKTFNLIEWVMDGAWINAAHTFIYYDENNRDTLQLTQIWQLDEWVNSHKHTNTYNSIGQRVGEGNYSTDSDGAFYLRSGLLYEYDNANHLIQKTEVKSNDSSLTYVNRYTWDYGEDNVLNAYTVSTFTNDAFVYVSRSIYNYLSPDTIIKYNYGWSDNTWNYTSKEVVFRGPGVYSSSPDSTHIFYEFIGQPEVLKEKRHTYYTLLDNGMVYFVNAALLYHSNVGQWLPYYKREEWYHVHVSVDNKEVPLSKDNLTIFPNPCRAGQKVSFLAIPDTERALEILIFDMQGRLIVHEKAASTPNFRTPERSGTYTVLFREKEQLLGVSKLIVTD